LTVKGRKTVARILARSMEIERKLLVDLSAQELQVLRSALEKISQRLDSL
jgi:MarR family transcriptional regulator for hemolysin